MARIGRRACTAKLLDSAPSLAHLLEKLLPEPKTPVVPMSRVRLFGIEIDPLRISAPSGKLLEWTTAGDGVCRYVVTPMPTMR